MDISTNWLQNAVKSFAVKNWQTYTYKREWLSVIVLLLVLKLATSAVSVFSGYFYLDNFFFGFLANETASKIFAVSALLLIEGLNALFCAKFFKFALRCKFLTALMPLTCAIVTFSISFVVSCNGIALFTSQSEDLTKVIESKYVDLLASAKNETDANIADVHTYIETIKANPENWSGGKRCVLSDAQNRELATAYERIANFKQDYKKKCLDLESAKAQELRENARVTTDTADKYYKIVAFIMFIQVACSAALWFFWCKISGQDAADIDYRESVDAVYDKANQLIDDGLANVISRKFSVITTAFSKLSDDLQPVQGAPAIAAKAAKRTGFVMPEPDENAPDKALKERESTPDFNAATDAVSGVANAAKTPQNAVAVCQHCGKPLTPSQVVRSAKYCCPRCRVAAYNANHPTRKPIVISNTSLKD